MDSWEQGMKIKLMRRRIEELEQELVEVKAENRQVEDAILNTYQDQFRIKMESLMEKVELNGLGKKESE